jgi:hypothetical protein
MNNILAIRNHLTNFDLIFLPHHFYSLKILIHHRPLNKIVHSEVVFIFASLSSSQKISHQYWYNAWELIINVIQYCNVLGFYSRRLSRSIEWFNWWPLLFYETILTNFKLQPGWTLQVVQHYWNALNLRSV